MKSYLISLFGRHQAMRLIMMLTFLFSAYGCSTYGPDELNYAVNEKNSVDGSSNWPNGSSTSLWNDYFFTVDVSTDGTIWTYTITRASSKSKRLSHLILDFQNCGDQSASIANIVRVTVNGLSADLRLSEGSGAGCEPDALTSNFVKINISGTSPVRIVVITFDRGFQIFSGANAWQKSGTSCNKSTLPAPGCPTDDPLCSYPQDLRGFYYSD